MKKLLSLCLICLMAVSAMAQYAPASDGYVDLGLPSGTLWKNANEGGDDARYSYDEAISYFGDKLPTFEQLEELINECEWTWTGNGYKGIGPNGNSITLPAAGYRVCDDDNDVCGVGAEGRYWSSTSYASYFAWSLVFFSGDGVGMTGYKHSYVLSVRLVK